MSKIEVKSSCLIPTATNPISMSRMDLAPWDLQFILLEPIQKGILFHKPESHHQPQLHQTTIVDHLKNSLSRTLDFFPPLAGRLSSVKSDDSKTSFFVDCNNAGAEFTHAVAGDVSISDILEPKYIPAEIVPSLFPLNGMSNNETSKPLLGVQVTELADGFFIGCTGNHAVLDGTSFWHFFNSWSEISRGFDAVSKTPVFERSFCRNNISIDDGLIVPDLLSWEKKQLLEKVFHFSKESVAKLKAKANSEAGSDSTISSLQALSAHLWRSVIRSRKNIHNISSIQEVFFILLVGARTRIPLPEGYFGNAVVMARTDAIDQSEVLQNGLGCAAMKINELVSKQTGEEAKKFVEEWVRNPIIRRKGGIDFVISSSPRHNVYGCDFGWGKPIAVRSGKVQKFDGKMTLFPGAVDGGIDVEVCLVPETMHAMEDDQEFLEALISTS